MKVPVYYRTFYDCLTSSFSPPAAFQENDSASEFLESKHLEQESRGERGARESGGSVHCHAYRHGLYCDDVGVGKPSVMHGER